MRAGVDEERGATPSPTPSTGERVVAWLAVAGWIAVIHSLGSDIFSSSETSRILGPLLRWLFPDAGPELLSHAQFAIRKAAHVIEYGLLALLALRALRLSFVRARLELLAASLTLVLVVAVVDEATQAASSERSGRAADVALDGFGGALALAVASAVRHRLSR